MEFLGIGPLEILLVVLLALVLFGPKDIVRNARNAGRTLNRLYKSDAWRTMNQASSALRNLPNRLAREAELEDLKEIQHELDPSRPAIPAAKPGPPPPSPGGGDEADGMAAWTPPGSPPSDPPSG
ncbi:MAG TPA: twin-arginine translocase TatA/TatE family subunit [Anaerolineales bacterium]|nr:twin-arginine translocase TatA/TatE family subunit [Anaerolineales bacterium]